jgi:hypothetical protein
VLSPSSGSIEFLAFEPDGDPITGFSVDSVTDSGTCSDGDNDGSCTVSGLDDENRVYAVSKSGHETIYVGATAVLGSSLTVNVVLTLEPTSSDTLQIHAIDGSTGAVITAFDVLDDSDDSSICTETSADGDDWCAASSAVPIGSITLRVESTDYVDGFATVTVTEDTTSVVYVALTPVLADPELTITVTSARTGSPVESASVVVVGLTSGVSTTCGTAGLAGSTDSDGSCVITTTDTSTLVVDITVSKDSGGETYASSLVVAPMAPGQIHTVSLTLVPTGSLTINTPTAPEEGFAISVTGIGAVCTVAEGATTCNASNPVPFGTWTVTAPGLDSATATITDFTGNSVTMSASP